MKADPCPLLPPEPAALSLMCRDRRRAHTPRKLPTGVAPV